MLLFQKEKKQGSGVGVGSLVIFRAWEFDSLTIFGTESWELGVRRFLGLGRWEFDSLTILGPESWESNKLIFRLHISEKKHVIKNNLL